MSKELPFLLAGQEKPPTTNLDTKLKSRDLVFLISNCSTTTLKVSKNNFQKKVRNLVALLAPGPV